MGIRNCFRLLSHVSWVGRKLRVGRGRSTAVVFGIEFQEYLKRERGMQVNPHFAHSPCFYLQPQPSGYRGEPDIVAADPRVRVMHQNTGRVRKREQVLISPFPFSSLPAH